MKVQYATPTVIESAGVSGSSSFSIAKTPHMFNILSSGLYADKVSAVLREIGCNAMDAHIMAGCPDRPFQVKLPSRLDRTFYIKDWGPGLSDEEVRSLYTTYGWSNKQTSDDVTGAFGLGSKSPFAYTDSFTVCAAKDGTKRVYTAHLDKHGAPVIARIFEGPSEPDWPSGVMVTFPVQETDIKEFANKAAQVFRWFSVKPEVLGLPSEALATPQFRYRSAFYGLMPDEHPLCNGSFVVTGNVRYPIETAQLGDALSQTHAALLASNLTLFLPIGEVMMTPSREHLQYTEQTKANLRKWLDKVVDDVAHELRRQLEAPAKSHWAWAQRIHRFAQNLPFEVHRRLSAFLDHAGASAQFAASVVTVLNAKTAKLPSAFGAQSDLGSSPSGPADAASDDAATPAQACHIPPHRLWVLQKYYTQRGDTVRRREVVRGRVCYGRSHFVGLEVPYASNCALVYADAPYANLRARAALASDYDMLLFVAPTNGTKDTSLKAVAEALSGMPGPVQGIPVVAASSLPLPEAAPVARAKSAAPPKDPQALHQLVAHETCRLASFAGTVSTVQLKDIGEAERYYALASSTGTLPSNKAVYNKVGGGIVSIRTHLFNADALRMMGELATLLDLPMRGFVVVDGLARLKRLRLAEQGYQPFFPALLHALEKRLQPLLKQNRSVIPPSAVRDAPAYNWGLYLVFARHRARRTPFWQMLKQELADSPLLQDFESKCPEWADMDRVARIDQHLEFLDARLNFTKHDALRVPSFRDTRSKGYLVRELPYAVAPGLKALNTDAITRLADCAPEQAVELLKCAAAMKVK